MKILVFESEIYSYHQIRTIVEDYDAQNEVIGPFTSTEHAREYLTEHAADVDIIISETVLSAGYLHNVTQGTRFQSFFIPQPLIPAETRRWGCTDRGTGTGCKAAQGGINADANRWLDKEFRWSNAHSGEETAWRAHCSCVYNSIHRIGAENHIR